MAQIRWKLKEIIHTKYGNQSNFAEAVDLSPQEVSAIVTGRLPICLEWAEKWSQLLSSELGELFPEYADD